MRTRQDKSNPKALTIRERRFARAYVKANGSATEAARMAIPLKTQTAQNYRATGSALMKKDRVREYIRKILGHEAMDPERLGAVHADFLALIDSPEPQDRRTALKALDMAYRILGVYAPSKHENVNVQAVVRSVEVEQLRDVLIDRRRADPDFGVGIITDMPEVGEEEREEKREETDSAIET